MATGVQNPPELLVRRLSAVGLWLLIINGMIGAGIFGVPAEAARLAGAFSPWVFAVCGFLTAPIMLCFAQLGSMFSGSGGPVLYAGTAFGPIIGFQAGWCMYIGRLTAFAANANLLVTSLGYFSGGAIGLEWRVLLLLAVCAALTLLNVAGAQTAMRSLGALTICKFLPLIALVLIGLSRLHVHLQTPLPIVVSDLGAAVLVVMYVFLGFESGPIAAGDARNPQLDVPRALLAALLVCSVLYVLIQAVAVATLPSLGSSTRPLLEVAAILMGPTGVLLMTAGVIASVGGNLMGSMFAVPRITYRLALDGYLPRQFCLVHPTFKTPLWSIVFFGTACFALAASGSFVWLAGLSVLTRIPVYLCCFAALPRIRKRVGMAPHALRLPGGNTVPLIAAMVCVGRLTQVKAAAYLSAAALIAVGTILYVTARQSSRRDG